MKSVTFTKAPGPHTNLNWTRGTTELNCPYFFFHIKCFLSIFEILGQLGDCLPGGMVTN